MQELGRSSGDDSPTQLGSTLPNRSHCRAANCPIALEPVTGTDYALVLFTMTNTKREIELMELAYYSVMVAVGRGAGRDSVLRLCLDYGKYAWEQQFLVCEANRLMAGGKPSARQVTGAWCRYAHNSSNESYDRNRRHYQDVSGWVRGTK